MYNLESTICSHLDKERPKLEELTVTPSLTRKKIFFLLFTRLYFDCKTIVLYVYIRIFEGNVYGS